MKLLTESQIIDTICEKNNIHPRLRQEIVEMVAAARLEKPSLAAKIIDIVKEVLAKIAVGKKGIRPTAQEYWLSRGYTEAEAYRNSKDARKDIKPRLSPYSREFWMQKDNPSTGKKYTEEEADFERNSRRPIKPEYWIARGKSEDEAKLLASSKKDLNNRSGAKNRDKEHFKKHSARCKEFWMLRGFTEEAAKKEVKKQQAVFSLEKLQMKYGEDKGLEIWKTRQEKWQKTLSDKSNEEKAIINAKKIGRGYSISVAEQEIADYLSNIFEKTQTQFSLFRKEKSFVYDIRVENKIIEYYGDYWHCNPLYFSPEECNKRSKSLAYEQWARDKDKIDYAINQGYEVLIIWEKDYREDESREINKCIQFLKT